MSISDKPDLLVLSVFGDSMSNSIRNADKIIVLKRTKMHFSLLRGDIALFREPGKNGTMLKRIIGVPGDKVTLKEGAVTIHVGEENLVLDEPYILRLGKIKNEENFFWNLGQGEYIVLGDYREKSKDSRTFGKIYDNSIIGKIIGKLLINQQNKEVVGIIFFDRYIYKKQKEILKAFLIKKKFNEHFQPSTAVDK